MNLIKFLEENEKNIITIYLSGHWDALFEKILRFSSQSLYQVHKNYIRILNNIYNR